MTITKEEIRKVLDAITGPIYGAPVFGEPVKAAITLLQSKLAEPDASGKQIRRLRKLLQRAADAIPNYTTGRNDKLLDAIDKELV